MTGSKTDGTLWAWGYNSDGQLGNGVADGSTAHPTPTQVGTAANWTHVVTHGYHVIAMRSEGTLWGWGYNAYGQVGNGTTTSPVTTPVQIGTATNWSSIVTGFYHTTATRTDGTLWSWGRNAEGQIGDGTNTNRSSPLQIGTATDWETVADGYYHTLATKTDGSLWSWGYNYYSQLGNAVTVNRSLPAQVGISAAWGGVFESSNQTLVTTAEGSLWACGFANNGSIGYAWRNQFVPDLVLPALSLAQTISFPSPGLVTVGNAVTLTATASSGLPASYIVAGPATLNGDQLTVTGPGEIIVIAYQPGDNYWQSSDNAFQVINPPSTEARLSALALNAGTLSPAFGSATTSYAASVANVNSSLIVTSTAANANASIQIRINGRAYGIVSSGVASNSLPLNVGANTLDLRVTAQDGVTVITYTVAVNRSTAYADWAASHGLSGANSGLGEDFDGDGVKNFVEWAFGTNGAVPDGGALSVNGTTITARGGPTTIKSGNGFLAAFDRREDYVASGLTYTVEFSADLTAPWVPNNAPLTAIADDGEIEVVTVPYPPLINGQHASFFHVIVTAQ